MTKYLLLITALVPLPALAQPLEDMGQLQTRIAARIDVDPARVTVDQRIKLNKCPEQPSIEAPAMGAVVVRCASLGWRIRVPVSGGVSGGDAAGAPVIRRGDVVEIAALGPGYAITSSGTALEDGIRGRAIRVRTGQTQPPLTAIVSDVGQVVIRN
jgi:flagella basal body P-ring formation protein FlgA